MKTCHHELPGGSRLIVGDDGAGVLLAANGTEVFRFDARTGELKNDLAGDLQKAIANRERWRRDVERLQAELSAMRHGDALIRADLAAYVTDCSTPTFQLVRNALAELSALRKEMDAIESDAMDRRFCD